MIQYEFNPQENIMSVYPEGIMTVDDVIQYFDEAFIPFKPCAQIVE